MDIYFEDKWPIKVLQFSDLPHDQTRHYVDHMTLNFPRDELTIVSEVKNKMVENGNSEHLMEIWFIMNNLTQVQFYPRTITFATLRTEHAMGYCNLTRSQYSHNYPNVTEFIWVRSFTCIQYHFM